MCPSPPRSTAACPQAPCAQALQSRPGHLPERTVHPSRLPLRWGAGLLRWQRRDLLWCVAVIKELCLPPQAYMLYTQRTLYIRVPQQEDCKLNVMFIPCKIFTCISVMTPRLHFTRKSDNNDEKKRPLKKRRKVNNNKKNYSILTGLTNLVSFYLTMPLLKLQVMLASSHTS